jgi:hypothetical protein
MNKRQHTYCQEQLVDEQPILAGIVPKITVLPLHILLFSLFPAHLFTYRMS